MTTYVGIIGAIGAHGLWKSRLQKAMENGSSEWHPSVVQRDDQCAFGKWLYGSSLTALEKNSPGYAECQELHRRFHAAAANVLALALAGKTEEANREMDPGSEFGRLSLALIRAMTGWYDALVEENRRVANQHSSSADDTGESEAGEVPVSPASGHSMAPPGQ